MDSDGVEVHKLAKKNETNIKLSWPNKHGKQRIYYMAFEEIFVAGYGGQSLADKVAPSLPLG